MASRLFSRSLNSSIETISTMKSNVFITGKDTSVRHGHHIRGKPPTIARNLKQRLDEINYKDPETSFLVDIGFKPPKVTRRNLPQDVMKEYRAFQKNPETERKSRLGKLRIDLEKVKAEWLKSVFPQHTRIAAEELNIFNDLFGDAYFTPVVPLTIDYDLEDNERFARVYRGNIIKPNEAKTAPKIEYEAKEDTLWSLLMTTPDMNFSNPELEYCHWFIGNIPGNSVEKGETLVDYMRPIPPRGLGYCRYVFVLYKQDKKLDFSEYKKSAPCTNLQDRNWKTLDFYRKHQDFMTPAGLAFFQADWDNSVTPFYHHTLGTKEPVYEYDFPQPYIRKQEWFPLGRPFNLYLDRYRDPKEINKEFLLKKLKNVHPFKAPEPPLKYPNAQPFPTRMTTWLKLEMVKERLGWGRVNEIK